MGGLVRHRQTKEPETDRPRLNHRATPRLSFLAEGGIDAECPGIERDDILAVLAFAARLSRVNSMAASIS